MTIYERGNAAKQAIFLALEQQAAQSSLRILDLACGDGRLWSTFLQAHPTVSVLGIDTDQQAIERGQKKYANPQLELRVFDAQQPLAEQDVDVVVAFSAIEHVVDRPAFLRTVWQALKKDGIAYLNYDAGHFRSWNVKERLMVPMSQLLALVGIQGPYMKRVEDQRFIQQALAQGFRLKARRKHNLHPLKGFFRGAPDQAVIEWVTFEERLNDLYEPDALDRIMWSTTLILEKS